MPVTVPLALSRPDSCGGLSSSASTMPTSTLLAVTFNESPARPNVAIGGNPLIAVDQREVLDLHRVVPVLDRRLRAGDRLPGHPLGRERETLQVHFLMIGMHDQRTGGGHRPLRLLRGRVERHLLVHVVGLRGQLVDVLPRDRHERARASWPRRWRCATSSSGTLAVKSLESDERLDCCVAVFHAVAADELPRGLQLALVAGDRQIDLADAGEGLVRRACRSAPGSGCRRAPSGSIGPSR